MSCELEKMRELVTGISRRRTFHEEGTASAKGQEMQTCLVCLENLQGAGGAGVE